MKNNAYGLYLLLSCSGFAMSTSEKENISPVFQNIHHQLGGIALQHLAQGIVKHLCFEGLPIWPSDSEMIQSALSALMIASHQNTMTSQNTSDTHVTSEEMRLHKKIQRYLKDTEGFARGDCILKPAYLTLKGLLYASGLYQIGHIGKAFQFGLKAGLETALWKLAPYATSYIGHKMIDVILAKYIPSAEKRAALRPYFYALSHAMTTLLPKTSIGDDGVTIQYPSFIGVDEKFTNGSLISYRQNNHLSISLKGKIVHQDGFNEDVTHALRRQSPTLKDHFSRMLAVQDDDGTRILIVEKEGQTHIQWCNDQKTIWQKSYKTTNAHIHVKSTTAQDDAASATSQHVQTHLMISNASQGVLSLPLHAPEHAKWLQYHQPKVQIDQISSHRMLEDATHDASFFQIQTVPTFLPFNLSSFTMNNTPYVFVPMYRNAAGGYAAQSILYAWNGVQLVEKQIFETQGAISGTCFSFNDTPYFAIANFYDGTSYHQNVVVYQWNGTQFDVFQKIPTNGASNNIFFTYGPNLFLFITQFYDDTTHYVTDSKLYQFNKDHFEERQTFATFGARNASMITINSTKYLIVPQYCDNTTYLLNSIVFRFDEKSSKFVTHQNIPTNGAQSSAAFYIQDNAYMAIGTCNNQCYAQNPDTREGIGVTIYQWSSSTKQFVPIQTLDVAQALSIQSLTSHNDTYLVISDYHSKVIVYIWSADLQQFKPFQEFSIKQSIGSTPFMINDTPYIAYSDDNMSTPIYGKIKVVKMGETLSINPQDASLQKQYDDQFLGLARAGKEMRFTFEDTYGGNSNASLTYQIDRITRTKNGIVTSLSDLAFWLTYNAQTRTFYGTPPSSDDHAEYAIRMSINNGSHVAYDTFTFKVRDIKTVLTDVFFLGNVSSDSILDSTFQGAAALSNDENIMYIVDSNATVVRTMDVQNKFLPSHVNTLNFIHPVTSMRTHPTSPYIYVAHGDNGFSIMNTQTPAIPLQGPLRDVQHGAYQFIYTSDYHWMYTTGKQLSIFNIDNPEQPIFAGTLDTGNVQAGTASSKALYLTSAQGITIVNITNPTAPTLSGVYATDAITHLTLGKDDSVLFASSGKKIDIFNLPNATTLTNVTTLTFDENVTALTLSPDKNYLFVGLEFSSTHVYNVRDLASIQLIRRLPKPSSHVTLTQNQRFGFIGKNSFNIFENILVDLEQLSISPTQIAEINNITPTFDLALSSDGTRVYAATDTGLSIYNVSVPTNPSLIGVVRPSTSMRKLQRSSTGQHLFASTISGVEILNLATNVNAPTLQGLFNASQQVHATAEHSTAKRLFLAAGNLQMLDISNVNIPTLISTLSSSFQDVRDVKISADNNTLFIADFSQGVAVFNITNVNQITMRSFISAPGAQSLTLSEDQKKIFVSIAEQGLATLNIANLDDLKFSHIQRVFKPNKLTTFEHDAHALLQNGQEILILKQSSQDSYDVIKRMYENNAVQVSQVTSAPYAYVANSKLQVLKMYNDARLSTKLISDARDGKKKFTLKFFLMNSEKLLESASNKIIDIQLMSGETFDDISSFPNFMTRDILNRQIIFEPNNFEQINRTFYFNTTESKYIKASDLDGVSAGFSGQEVIHELVAQGYMTNDGYLSNSFDPNIALNLSPSFNASAITAKLKLHYAQHKTFVHAQNFLDEDLRPSYSLTLQKQFNASVPYPRVGKELNFQFDNQTFNDHDDSTLTYTVENVQFRSPNGNISHKTLSEVSWLTFDTTTRRLKGTPPLNLMDYTLTLTIRANDGYKSTTGEFDIQLNNAAPVQNVALQTQLDMNSNLIKHPEKRFEFVFDGETFIDSDADQLTYTAELLTESGVLQLSESSDHWLKFNAEKRMFYGTPTASDLGSYAVHLSAYDGLKTASQHMTFTIENKRPILNKNIQTQLKNQPKIGNFFEFALNSETFTDPDGDTLSLTAQQANGKPLPDWLRFDSVNAIFTGTPDTFDQLNIEVTAEDASHQTVRDHFMLHPQPSSLYVMQTLMTILPPVAGVLSLVKYRAALHEILCQSRYQEKNMLNLEINKTQHQTFNLMYAPMKNGYALFQKIKQNFQHSNQNLQSHFFHLDGSLHDENIENVINQHISDHENNLGFTPYMQNLTKVVRGMLTYNLQPLNSNVKKAYQKIKSHQNFSTLSQELNENETLSSQERQMIRNWMTAQQNGVYQSPITQWPYPFHSLKIKKGTQLHMKSLDIKRIELLNVMQTNAWHAPLMRLFKMHLQPQPGMDNQMMPSWINFQITNDQLHITYLPDENAIGSYVLQIQDKEGFVVSEQYISVQNNHNVQNFSFSSSMHLKSEIQSQLQNMSESKISIINDSFRPSQNQSNMQLPSNNTFSESSVQISQNASFQSKVHPHQQN